MEMICILLEHFDKIPCHFLRNELNVLIRRRRHLLIEGTVGRVRAVLIDYLYYSNNDKEDGDKEDGDKKDDNKDDDKDDNDVHQLITKQRKKNEKLVRVNSSCVRIVTRNRN